MSIVGKGNTAEKKCLEASHHWFSENGVDSTIVDSVSIGRVLQLQVFEKLFESSQVNADRNDIRSILKRLNLEWSVRAVASLFGIDSDRSQAKFLLVFDVNNDPMIQALNAIGKSLEEQGESVCAVTIDSSISTKCALSRKISWFKCFTRSDFTYAVKKYFLTRRISSDAINKGFDRLKQDFGRSKANKIRRYYATQVLQVLLEIAAIYSLLRNKKPKVVVLASDAHRVSRIFVFLCKSLKIRTVVYQHGATIWEYGYVPVYADHMLVWGRSARDWFEERGVSSDKLVEVGNLRSDAENFKFSSSYKPSVNRTVYFFPNPIDREITKNVIGLLVEICTAFDLKGVIKLHPSEKNLDFFKDAVSEAKCSIDISTAPMSKVGIKAGDVAIVVNSTAGVDCCLQGAYVLNVEIKNMPNPIDYEGYGVGVKTSMDDYIGNFKRLLDISFDDYLLKREEFIKSYFGDLDGKVLDRVNQFVVDLARNNK